MKKRCTQSIQPQKAVFEQYVAWLSEKKIEDHGQSKFNQFINLLKTTKLSYSVSSVYNQNYSVALHISNYAIRKKIGCTFFSPFSLQLTAERKSNE
jgi:hypothetical protein